MLRYADLAGLEAAGVEIGAHSHTHRQLDLLPERAVAAELTRSSTTLAEALGHRIRSLYRRVQQIARGPSRPMPARAGQVRSQPAMADEHHQHRR